MLEAGERCVGELVEAIVFVGGVHTQARPGEVAQDVDPEAAGAAGLLVPRLAAHLDAGTYGSWNDAKAAIAKLPMKKLRTGLVTAHLMGGCAMGEDRKLCVVNSRGRHHEVENLSVFDGSMFPSSIGANPQLSIYGFVARNATALAEELAPLGIPPHARERARRVPHRSRRL